MSVAPETSASPLLDSPIKSDNPPLPTGAMLLPDPHYRRTVQFEELDEHAQKAIDELHAMVRLRGLNR